jgi:hypothetical protein
VAELPVKINVDVTSAVKGFTSFMGQVFGPAATEIGELLGDRVQLWKRLNAHDVAAKYHAKILKRGLDPDCLEPLKLGEAVPLIEAASYEENDEVQELWAELLVNAQDPAANVTAEKVFIALLRELGPCEAILLRLASKFNGILGKRLPPEAAETVLDEYRAELEPFTREQREAAVLNLRRLGLVRINVAPKTPFNVIQEVRLGSGLNGTLTTLRTREFERMFKWLIEQIEVAGGAITGDLGDGSGFQLEGRFVACPELGIILTPLGQRLSRAVSADASPEEDQSIKHTHRRN